MIYGSRASRTSPAERLYARETEEGVCTETAFRKGTEPKSAVSRPTPNRATVGLEREVLEQESTSSSRRSSHTHTAPQTHTTTNQPTTEETATANATADIPIHVRGGLNSFVEVGA